MLVEHHGIEYTGFNEAAAYHCGKQVKEKQKEWISAIVLQ